MERVNLEALRSAKALVTTALVKYEGALEQARQRLVEATTIGEVKDIFDKAAANPGLRQAGQEPRADSTAPPTFVCAPRSRRASCCAR
jgi:hypothetical protein